ncbi:MAG: hypothetical protein M3O74_05590 [Pseudomonadota bacterium]|nr:hypothetical protein [Pseudomonadota bacterium]
MKAPQDTTNGDTAHVAKLDGRTGRIIAFVFAVLPAVWTYTAAFVDKVRTTELEYVNRQIEKLYGPLYALTEASNVAWEQFHNMYWPKGGSRYFFDPSHPPKVEGVDQWRNWMLSVFQPNNIKIETVIVDNAQLVIGDRMPAVFKEAIAQTEAYRAVIANWKDSDRNNAQTYVMSEGNTVTGLNYPASIGTCVRDGYMKLKDRQQKLQGNAMRVLFLKPLVPDSSCEKSSRLGIKAIEFVEENHSTR